MRDAHGAQWQRLQVASTARDAAQSSKGEGLASFGGSSLHCTQSTRPADASLVQVRMPVPGGPWCLGTSVGRAASPPSGLSVPATCGARCLAGVWRWDPCHGFEALTCGCVHRSVSLVPGEWACLCRSLWDAPQSHAAQGTAAF